MKLEIHASGQIVCTKHRISKVLAVTYLGEGGVPETCSASHDPKASSAVDDFSFVGAAISASISRSIDREQQEGIKGVGAPA